MSWSESEWSRNERERALLRMLQWLRSRPACPERPAVAPLNGKRLALCCGSPGQYRYRSVAVEQARVDELNARLAAVNVSGATVTPAPDLSPRSPGTGWAAPPLRSAWCHKLRGLVRVDCG